MIVRSGAIKHWRDIGYSAVVVSSDRKYSVRFRVYAHDGWNEVTNTPLYRCDGSRITPDPVSGIKDAEIYAHGYVKKDGCTDWIFGDRAYMHGCTRDDVLAWGEMVARCWDWAMEIMEDTTHANVHN